MSHKNTAMLDPSTALVLRGPTDLVALGPFIRARRKAAGFRSAKEAAPHLAVTTRLLVEVERGGRTKRGISLGKLLSVLQMLGYEVELRPRRAPVVGAGALTLPPLSVRATDRVTTTSSPSGKAAETKGTKKETRKGAGKTKQTKKKETKKKTDEEFSTQSDRTQEGGLA